MIDDTIKENKEIKKKGKRKTIIIIIIIIIKNKNKIKRKKVKRRRALGSDRERGVWGEFIFNFSSFRFFFRSMKIGQ